MTPRRGESLCVPFTVKKLVRSNAAVLVVGALVAACASWTEPPGAASPNQPSSACLEHGTNCRTDSDCCSLNCKNNMCVLPIR